MTYDVFTLHQLFFTVFVYSTFTCNSAMKAHKVEMLNKPLLLSLLYISSSLLLISLSLLFLLFVVV